MYDIPQYTLVTDAVGRLRHDGAADEPPLSSVALTNGLTGTAFQRQHDGLWHRCGGRPAKGKTWERMLQMRSLVVVYRAPLRDEAASADA